MLKSLMISLCLLAMSRVTWAEESPRNSTKAVGQKMTGMAKLFVKMLSDAEKGKTVKPFNDPSRVDWHNIPKPERKGFQFREMNPDQRKVCLGLLSVSLSKEGYDKVRNIMSLEANLREGEKNIVGGHLRDPERYFLTIFGAPHEEDIWGWSFEGHHLSLNFVINNGEVVSDTPSFWGANPATVKVFVDGGPEVGTRTLAAEEQTAFDLVQSLDESQLKKAVIAAKAPADYRAAGLPQPPTGPVEGLSAKEMTPEQQKTLWKLLEVYNHHLAEPVAKARLEALETAGLENISLAWAGSTKPGVGHYFRVQGPTFVLELVNIQSDPQGNPANHIHSVWRSLKGDFAIPLTAQ